MNRRQRAQRRVAQSRVPVRPSIHPKENAPLWATSIAGAFLTIYAAVASLGISGPTLLVLVIVLVVLGLGAQTFTRPKGTRLEHD